MSIRHALTSALRPLAFSLTSRAGLRASGRYPVALQQRHTLLSSPPLSASFSAAPSAGPASCWKCSKPTDEGAVFCNDCGSLQAPSSKQTPFETLGLEPVFTIDSQTLEKKFKKLMRQLHPDRFHAKSEEERGFAAEHSARLNQAYKAIREPLSRSLQLLAMHGNPLREQEGVEDPELLETIMNLNERIHQATPGSETLTKTRDEIKSMLDSALDGVERAFENHDLQKAKEATVRLRYATNLAGNPKLSE